MDHLDGESLAEVVEIADEEVEGEGVFIFVGGEKIGEGGCSVVGDPVLGP